MLLKLAGIGLSLAMLVAPVAPRAAVNDGTPAGGAEQDDGAEPAFRVLLFTRTAGFRHDSIIDGVKAISELGAKHGFAIDHSADDAVFTSEHLARYAAVIFLNTTGNILDDAQRDAFESFIRQGGGFVGIHAAADCGYDWSFYGRLVGAYFESHPRIQEATIIVEDRDHPATRHLPTRWTRTDEWYNFRTHPRPPEASSGAPSDDRRQESGTGSLRVLMRLDTGTYEGSTMGEDHPIAWCHAVDRGRAFYTACGHTRESFAEPLFLEHLHGAIRWAACRSGEVEEAGAAGNDESHPAAPRGQSPG